MTDSQKWLTLVILGALSFLTYLLQPILMPFLAGLLLAYLAGPIIDRLVGWKLPRLLAVGLVFFSISLFFLLVIGGLVPGIKDQVLYLNAKMPAFIEWINGRVVPWVEDTFKISFHHVDINMITDFIGSSWQQAGTMIGQVLSRLALSGMSIVTFIANIALIPIVTFYLMVDWPKLIDGLDRLIPRKIHSEVTLLTKECDEVLSAFFRGQFLVMICLSLVYTFGLKIVGLDVAVIVGLIAGLGSIIPYLGFSIGIVVGTIAAIFQFQELLPVVWVWTVFGIGQILEGWVLVPYLVGNKVGLHPVIVIFSILAGGQLFGFFGMLLAIPAAAIIFVLLRHIQRRYLESNLYLTGKSAAPKEDGF